MSIMSFPIILHKHEINSAIYAPIEAFVDFVNMLLRGHVPSDKLPVAFLDLYALDFYDKQVRNGGHSQFIGNSGARLQGNLEHALRGARTLGVEELEQLLEECRDWCEANPIERDRQDGWSHRAAALDTLDDRLYIIEYDDDAFTSFIEEQPETVRVWINAATEVTDFRARSKYHLAAAAWLLKQSNTRLMQDNDADAAIESIVSRYARL